MALSVRDATVPHLPAMRAVLIPLLAGLLAVLIAISALLSALETALFSLRPVDLERLKKRNQALAGSLRELMENPRRLLSAILLGDSFSNLPLIICGIYLIRRLFSPFIPFWLAALILFAIIVLLCDLIPKMIALSHPYRIARLGVAILRPILPILDPVSHLLQNLSEKVAEWTIPANLQPADSLTEEELGTLVELSAEEGALHATESEMIREIIKLGDKTVRDCMTPRIDTFAIPDDRPNEEIIPELKEKRRRRVPIYAETPDNILGILDVPQFLFDPTQHYTEIMSPPSYVPETMKALDLLRSFLTHPQGMAIIVDEFGGTEGIVTLADIVEEIISDAVPSADHNLYIETLEDGRLIVNGNARLDDLNELLGVKLEAEGLDTIGGLIFNRLGYLPKPGFILRLGPLFLTIRRTSRKRVEEILITPEAKPPAPAAGEVKP